MGLFVVSFAALALRARAANDTTPAQINNIPSKSHVIPLLSILIHGYHYYACYSNQEKISKFAIVFSLLGQGSLSKEDDEVIENATSEYNLAL